MPSDILRQQALAYAKAGLRVFPLHWVRSDGKGCSCGRDEDCDKGKWGKHPYHPFAPSGFKDATTDAEVIDTWWRKAPLANIGIATEGLLVVDVDLPGGEETLHKWQLDHDDLPETLTSTTGTGGKHIVFSVPDGTGGFKRELGPKVDLKAAGGYIVAPPSRNGYGEYRFDGDGFDVARIAAAPGFLIDAARGGNGASRREEPLNLDQSSHVQTVDERLELCLEALADVQGAVEGERGDDRTYDVACLGADFGLIPDQFWPVLRAWNARCEPPWPDRELRAKMDHAYQYRQGRFGSRLTTPRVAQAREVLERAEPEPKAPAEEPREPFPQDLLEACGGLQATYDYILGSAPKPQPILALGASLALWAGVLGRRVTLAKRGLDPRLYVLLVAPSGSGKEHARTAISRVYQAVNHRDRLIDELASDAALLGALSKAPDSLLCMDEFGAMLGTLGSKNAPSHLAQMERLLLRLYGYDDPVFRKTYNLSMDGKDKGEKREITISRPTMSMLAMSTGRVLWSNLTHERVTGGLLGRMLIFESETPNPEEPPEDTAIDPSVPLSVIEPLQAWLDLTKDTQGKTLVGAMRIPYAPGAAKHMDEIKRHWWQLREDLRDDFERESVIGRPEAFVRKVAMLRACAGDPEVPQIAIADLDWAQALIRHCARKLLRAVGENPSGLTQLAQTITDFVVENGPIGRKTVWGKWRRWFDRYDYRRALDMVADMGGVEVVKPGAGRGRKLVIRPWTR